MAKKIGRMKKKCQAYTQAGHYQINKDEKAKKNLARIEHFAKRHEEGKAYEYVPPVDDKEKKKRAKKQRIDAQNKHDRKSTIQIWDSIYRKLDNQIQAEKLAEKEKARNKRK